MWKARKRPPVQEGTHRAMSAASQACALYSTRACAMSDSAIRDPTQPDCTSKYSICQVVFSTTESQGNSPTLGADLLNSISSLKDHLLRRDGDKTALFAGRASTSTCRQVSANQSRTVTHSVCTGAQEREGGVRPAEGPSLGSDHSAYVRTAAPPAPPAPTRVSAMQRELRANMI